MKVNITKFKELGWILEGCCEPFLFFSKETDNIRMFAIVGRETDEIGEIVALKSEEKEENQS